MSDGAHRPTLAAVAARAGVSASTASLAFSGSGPVSEATRERVMAAARELNYAGPDPRARSLRRGRSGIVGVVLDDRVRDAFRDPIMIPTLDGLSEELGTIDAGVLLLTEHVSADAKRERSFSIADVPMDAVVFVGCRPRLDDTISTFGNRGIPVAAIEGDVGDEIVQITQDNREATRYGAEHLRDLGHTRVGVITLPLDRVRATREVDARVVERTTADTARDRFAGARDVFPHPRIVAAAGSLVEEGMIAARILLDVDASERPTAIIAQSDLLAAGAIRAAEQLGIAVPEQLSVLGFDGVRVDGLWPYDLATLVQPALEKGRAAGRAIIEMLGGADVQSRHFTSEFHRGNTTAPPPPPS
jgi:DNA-binding LacI/PurR family transcriptional regulator